MLGCGKVMGERYGGVRKCGVRCGEVLEEVWGV